MPTPVDLVIGLLISAAPTPIPPVPGRDTAPAALIEFLGSPDAELVNNDVFPEPNTSVAKPSPTTSKPKTIR